MCCFWQHLLIGTRLCTKMLKQLHFHEYIINFITSFILPVMKTWNQFLIWNVKLIVYMYMYIYLYTHTHIRLYRYASPCKFKTNLDILYIYIFLLMSWAVCYTGNMPWFIHSNRFHLQLGLNFPSFEEFHAVNNVHLDYVNLLPEFPFLSWQC